MVRLPQPLPAFHHPLAGRELLDPRPGRQMFGGGQVILSSAQLERPRPWQPERRRQPRMAPALQMVGGLFHQPLSMGNR